MQLLKITNQPAKIKINAEAAELQLRQKQAESSRRIRLGKLKLHSQNIQVKIDTYSACKSLGLIKTSDAIRNAASKGLQASDEVVAEYAKIGNQLAQAHKGVSVADAYAPRLAADFTTEMVFLPTVGAQLSWEAGNLDTEYTPGDVTTDWETGGTQMDFVPSKFSIEMLQYPDVKIEYTGRPNYVPPSADPEHENVEE